MRDWGVLHRLGKQSTPLNATHVLTQQATPLRGAFLQHVWYRDLLTFVWRPNLVSPSGFVQCRLNEARSHAHILWIGTPHTGDPNTLDEQMWLELLEQLTFQLGQQGIQSVIAEAEEASAEQAILREAGFAVYTRQDIWQTTSESDRVDVVPKLLRPRKSTDDWDVELLYAHIVPPMIRMVEPHPPSGEDDWIYYEGSELRAYVTRSEGALASWVRVFVSLDAKVDATELVAEALALSPVSAEKPLYCCVRNYQDWLNFPFQKNGFQLFANQAVMVKHTVQHVKKPTTSLEAVLQTNGATAQTTQMIHKHPDPHQLAEQGE